MTTKHNELGGKVDELIERLEKVESYYKRPHGPGPRIQTIPHDPSSFAHLVRELRLSQKLSQSEFSDCYGVDLETLQNWEQGRRQPNSVAETLMFAIKSDPELVKLAAAEARKRRKMLVPA